MKKYTIAMILVAGLAIAGCGTTTGQRSGSGAAMGAAGGALIGSLSANAGKGALIGALGSATLRVEAMSGLTVTRVSVLYPPSDWQS